MRMYTRWAAAAVLLAGLASALPLHAAAVQLAPVTIAAPLQAALHERYGSDEGAVLKAAVTERLVRSLKAAGASLDAGAPLRIEVSIEDAAPTHPTRHQLALNPGLDFWRSVSLGGAHLRAVLRSADGRELERVDFDHYAPTLDLVSPSADAWGDARVTIERFSDQVVKVWQRRSGA